ncbi:MAG: MBL fold metallo-hydrolase, partial [Candidatus Hydrogenedentes bacterium]|nr:MBL fold metallo-hydrolase [Candidatus Hydrogenedentota bacterium]
MYWVIAMTLAEGRTQDFRAGDETLAPGIYVLHGAVNIGVIVRDGHALLIDCCDTVTSERLSALGVHDVELILCTQFRRTHNAGMYPFVAQGVELSVPKVERALFESAEEYWGAWSNRWHLYHARPGPLVPARSVKVNRSVGEGDTIQWRGVTVRVIDTPGATDGSISYIVATGEHEICFCGDVVCAPGRVWELYSLQKGFGGVGDYHGFLGAREAVLDSARKLASCDTETFVPSHGTPFPKNRFALDLLEKRFDALQRNYAAISALNHYFPHLFEALKDDPLRMKPAETLDLPAWVRRVAFTSYAVVSDSGAALLIDCGHDSVLTALDEWKCDGHIDEVEGCRVT